MNCIKHIADDLLWVGANDRRLLIFEGVYSVPDGVAYNSYLMLDEKTVLFDTVDKAVRDIFLENVEAGLAGRRLDYLILHHIEPDHSSGVGTLLLKYPDVTIVVNEKSSALLDQFFKVPPTVKRLVVKEGDSLSVGRHKLNFVMAPMIHWPEVMMTYESTDRILFSADAFGTFGALNGAIFADEVDFAKDYMDEARRYYANIVGKYGQQVQALFKKAESLTIDMICPLHGFVWRKYINEVMRPYTNWSRYEPEEQGVMIAYASVYGNTENAAEILACRLRDAKIKTVMYDVSVTPASNIVAACFKWSHLVFASTTYNAGIFVTMESLIYDLVAHNIQNRTVAFIENGSWATASGKLMRSELESCKNMTFLDTISLTSSVSTDNQQELCNLAKTVADTFVLKKTDSPGHTGMNADALWKVPYGLFLVTAQDGDFDNGCIINTAEQITALPVRMTVSIDKSSLTHDMILKTNKLAVSVLTKAVPYYLLQHFGFNSGKNVNKFDLSESSPLYGKFTRLSSGLYGLTKYANAIFEGTVISSTDCASHTLFFIEIDAAHVISDEPSCTYEYYLGHIKPMPKPPEEGVSGYICKICGYIHEGEELPDDIICPICKHGAIDFEKL